eukprot:CAMPEP_0172323696 /NCGR_PEP_ID=MMETSP1058-20130122/49432_1 /TAXON_ID=83371 /ORGANISM="Detonula confervacea, Strain CCMP 353" /LENGTH=264 /DNA_ID=CAMNT_0013039773 /DNA_START=222 /DNA_END=1016 /DNA_ORIENTATION=+
MNRATLIALYAIIGHAGAFNLPSITDIFKPPSPAASKFTTKNDELQLVQAISNTGNGKDADIETQTRVLSIVRRLETNATPSPTLLSNPVESKLLDGDWFLQYTAPSEIDAGDAAVSSDDKWVAVDGAEGDSNIETRQFKNAGSVSGGGIPVSAASAIQSFDIEESRVKNEVPTGFGKVTVGGTFSQSPTVPLRALVAFDTAKIELNVGLTIDISFLFDIRAAIQGSKDAGWLETTYLSNDMRIGRGNKGSMFILTRDQDAVKP